MPLSSVILGCYHQYDIIAFPENHHATGNFEAVKSSIAARWKMFTDLFTRQKDSSVEHVRLLIPSALEIQETCLKIYSHEFQHFLSSDFGDTFPLRANVYHMCHIFTSLTRIYVTTSPTSIAADSVKTFEKQLFKMKKVST